MDTSTEYKQVMAAASRDIQADMQAVMQGVQAAKAHMMLLGRWTTQHPICVKLDKLMQSANEITKLAQELAS